MTERKKPGPKPKCKECGRKEGEGHYDDCPVGLGVLPPLSDSNMKPEVMAAVVTAAKHPERVVDPAAYAYALRVWNGQSVDVPRAEKLRRVALALEGQGLSMEGVSL